MLKNKSPAKKLRDLRRSVAFIKVKNHKSHRKLEVCLQSLISITPLPGPPLSLSKLPTISIPPKTPVKQNLVYSGITNVDIPTLSTTLPNNVSQPGTHYVPEHLSEIDEEQYARNRENVRNTLALIDAALNYGRS